MWHAFRSGADSLGRLRPSCHHLAAQVARLPYAPNIHDGVSNRRVSGANDITWLSSASVVAFLDTTANTVTDLLYLCTTCRAAIAILTSSGYLQLSAKKAAALGTSSKYGGNILGGLLIGAGMALSGACPGTVLIQAVQGIPSGVYASIGAFAGGFAYSAIKRIFSLGTADTASPSIDSELGVSPLSAFAGYELLCGTILGISTLPALKKQWPIDPIAGGLIIGAAQIASLLLRRSTVGVSSVFGDTAENAITLLSKAKTKKYAWAATQFGVALMAGSYLLTILRPELVATSSMVISPSRAILGGLLMSMGSRHAGGCTSGHGLSGMAQLSVSSFITTAAMFAGGIPVALLA